GTLTLDGENATQLGLEGRIVAVPASRYVQGRAFGLHRFGPKVTATLDVDAVGLDPAINGPDLSLTVAGTGGWGFSPGGKAVLMGLTGQTPLLEWRTEAMAKVVYNWDYHVQKKAGP